MSRSAGATRLLAGTGPDTPAGDGLIRLALHRRGEAEDRGGQRRQDGGAPDHLEDDGARQQEDAAGEDREERQPDRERAGPRPRGVVRSWWHRVFPGLRRVEREKDDVENPEEVDAPGRQDERDVAVGVVDGPA